MSGSAGRFGSGDRVASRRTGRFVPMIISGALALAGLTALSMQNALADDAMTAGSRGKQPTAWGPPYPNMPDIVPPNVRATEYGPVSEKDAPPIDPTKGYRVENFGGARSVSSATRSRRLLAAIANSTLVIFRFGANDGARAFGAIDHAAGGRAQRGSAS